jgi:hypothetical protein
MKTHFFLCYNHYVISSSQKEKIINSVLRNTHGFKVIYFISAWNWFFVFPIHWKFFRFLEYWLMFSIVIFFCLVTRNEKVLNVFSLLLIGSLTRDYLTLTPTQIFCLKPTELLNMLFIHIKYNKLLEFNMYNINKIVYLNILSMFFRTVLCMDCWKSGVLSTVNSKHICLAFKFELKCKYCTIV